MTTPNSPNVAALPLTAATPPGPVLPVEEVPVPSSAAPGRAPEGNMHLFRAASRIGCEGCGGRLVTRYRPEMDGDVDAYLMCVECGWES